MWGFLDRHVAQLSGIACLILCFSLTALAQTSTITYQGRLTDGGTPANGTYDLQFKLYDALTNGNLQGSPNTVTKTGVNVASGVFTVQLDFGAGAFPGADRFLDIGVKHPADSSYTPLAPRQQLTSSPYAIRSATAASAENATNATTATTATNNVLKSGDTMTGQLVLSGNPTASLGAATKQYVDSADALKLNLSGGTMTGTLDLGSNKITSLATPTNGTDAANKSYVDAAVIPATNFFFGDGSDGDVTITGATTLTRDMYYHDLTINADQTLNPGGFRVFVSGTLTLANGAGIARNGKASTGFGGPALVAGTLGGSGAGAGAGGSCCSGSGVANSLGGKGGNSISDVGGSATPPAVSAGGGGVFRSALQALSGRSLDGVVVNGGGGGASASNLGGLGGGGGGGVVVVAVRTVVLSGGAATITAKGGFGDGGGGGGVVVVITTTPQPAGLTLNAGGGNTNGLGSPGQAGFTAWLN